MLLLLAHHRHLGVDHRSDQQVAAVDLEAVLLLEDLRVQVSELLQDLDLLVDLEGQFAFFRSSFSFEVLFCF